MNRLKALPWTQILLFLLLVSSVMNYFEMRRVKEAVYYVESDLQDQATAGQLDDIGKQIEEINQHLH